MATKLARLMTYLEGLLSYNLMIFNQVVLLDNVKILKNYVSTLIRLMATKLGRVLTLGRKFSMQMLKLSPNS